MIDAEAGMEAAAEKEPKHRSLEKLTIEEVVRRGLTPVREPQIVYLEAARSPTTGYILLGHHTEFDPNKHFDTPLTATAYVLGKPRPKMNAERIDDFYVPIQFYRP